MKTKITLILLAFFMFVGDIYSQIDTDPDRLGGPVIIGDVLPFTLPVDTNANQQKTSAKSTKTTSVISKTAAIPILEWPNPGAVHIEKTAVSAPTLGRWKINVLTQGKNIPITTDVVLVIDNSGSMSGTKITSAKSAATTFVNELLNGSTGIRLAIVTINAPGNAGTPYVNQGFTDNTTTLNTAISGISASGGTNLQGGFYAARQLIGTSTATKKVVILLSDGAPTYSYNSTVTTNFTVDCGSISNFNISRNDFEASHITVTSSNYSNIVGTGGSFDYTLYSFSKNCAGNSALETFTAGNHGIPTKYEAGLVINSGVDVYTIGFEVPVGGDEQDVLNGSQNKGYFPATSGNITSVYSQIRSNIAYAATNAIFTDPMSTYIVLEAGVTPTFSVLPSTTGNVVVTKGTVTFANNGYVLNDPDNPLSGNSSLIKWKITWNIGTISEIGDQMYYYVNMAPNTDPTILYDANETTFMNYTDVNGSLALQTTPTHFTIPKVSGGKGSIEIHYYTVNESGQPINSVGTVVPKENAVQLIPGNSTYFIYNGSTALDVNQAYTVSPESIYTSNSILYQLYCTFGNVSVTPTPSAPNQVVWFGYRVSVAPTTTLVQPTCTVATGSITVTAPLPGTGISYTVTGTNPVLPAVTNTTGVFAGLTPGIYSVTSKSAAGCNSIPATVTINAQPIPPTASISAQTNVDCFGNSTGSVTVAGTNGTAPYTYAKDGITFVASGTFGSLAAGSYTITVKDANGCTKTQAVTITQPLAALTASISVQTNVDCFGNSTGSVTVAGANGTAPYTYAKDGITFVASGTFGSLAAGSYTITVKDANGCTKTQAVTITQPLAALTASISAQTNVDCFGNSTGSVTVAGANGTAPYTYAKDGITFVASGTFGSLAAGSYTITVKDANGCTKTQAVTITQPAAALTASITSQTNVNCFGNSTGSVTVAGANGTAPYTYAKDGITFVASGTFGSLAAGSYTITVKDANGCTKTQAVTITQPLAALTASISAQTNVDCFGNSTGSVTVAGANGTAPYTYAKDGITFVASGTFGSLAAGSYTITVKDANGCTKTQAVTITQPLAALTASISAQTNVDCFGNSTGSVTVAGANGTAPYTYAKDGITFVASGTFGSLAAGSYTITVKDANGCTKTQAVTITQPLAALTASISAQTNVDCFGNSTGSVTVAGANGTAPYTYAKDGITFVASGTFGSLAAGSYTITVKDANGCTKTQAVTITQPLAAITCSIIQNKAVSL